jgi:hypothetical protein
VPTREVFEAYVEHFLVSTLRPGQVVVINNLGAHRLKRLSEKGYEQRSERGFGPYTKS